LQPKKPAEQGSAFATLQGVAQHRVLEVIGGFGLQEVLHKDEFRNQPFAPAGSDHVPSDQSSAPGEHFVEQLSFEGICGQEISDAVVNRVLMGSRIVGKVEPSIFLS